MLSDRSYMRDDYHRRTTSSLIWLVAGTIAAFVLQLVLSSPWFSWGESVLNQLPLTIRGLQSGHLWTLVTHALLHRTDQPFHILCTVLGLIFIGRELEPILGGRRLVALYLGAIICGALTWSAIHWLHGGFHIGPGAGILGLFVVLACMYPNQEIGFLLIPVTLRFKYLVYGSLGLTLFGLVFYEIPGAVAPFDYSASAHLGGMLAGWLYFRYFHANNGWDRAPSFALPAWLNQLQKPRRDSSASKANHDRSADDLRAQVDLILDKINSQGFGALTSEEKQILDEAKDLLSRH